LLITLCEIGDSSHSRARNAATQRKPTTKIIRDLWKSTGFVLNTTVKSTGNNLSNKGMKKLGSG
jgi:hypothetical protein